MRRIPFPLLLLTLAGSIPPGAASAQIAILDRGQFEVAIGGQDVGTETFTIRQVGTGEDTRVIAAGQIRTTSSSGPLTMDILIEVTGPEWIPSAYQNKVGGAEAQQIGFELRGARFESRVTSELGEQVKEYRALPATAIVERGVAHHFHFLGPRASAAPVAVPIIVPRDGLQFEAEVAAAGTRDVRIGGEMISARHYRVGAGTMQWEVWYDDAGRVLQVVENATGYSATRMARPGS